MRITNLVLQDYKCFEYLELKDLGDRVVLVGPNGCGKSAILESIAVLKEFIGSYRPVQNPYGRTIAVAQKYVSVAWPSEIPLPIRGEQTVATISATIVLDEMEIQITGVSKAEYSLAVEIQRSGEVTFSSDNTGIAKLFQHYDPASGIGVLDYISPYRVIPLQKISTLDLNSLSLEQQRMERIELQREDSNYQKFRSVKQFIISQQLEDLGHMQLTGILRDSIAHLKKLFAEFFTPKILLGYSSSGNEMHVSVQTPSGIHDIDQLSSGERELFFVLTNLFRIRMLPSVILYDEPERHLNPGLEARLIPALDSLQTKNQLWIATHGMELINSVPLEQIVALQRAGSTGKPERFTDGDSKSRIRIYESLGAKVGLQLACSQVVFVEGKSSHGDKQILDKLIGGNLPGVLFVASGAATDAMGAATRASLLIQGASTQADFMMVLDRDYRDNDSLNQLKNSLKDHLFFWDFHEIENLFLDPIILLEALKINGESNFSLPEDVDNALLDVAKEQKEMFVCQMVAYRLNNHVNFNGSGNSFAPNDKNNLMNMIESRRDRITKAYESNQISSLINSVEQEILQSYENRQWRNILPGKEILNAFRTKYLPKLGSDLFKEHIIYVIANGNQPPALEKLVEFIRSKQA